MKNTTFISVSPTTGETLWEGNAASKEEVNHAIQTAKFAFPKWGQLPIKDRFQYLKTFQEILKKNKINLTEIISKETGKTLWDSEGEVNAMINKIDISHESYELRCGVRTFTEGETIATTRHKPHGVVGVLGPFNFPAHLPNGHIIPALLAGNTVVWKGSELTPLIAETVMNLWKEVSLPEGVLNLVQGAQETGQALATHPDLDALMFTGSYKTGLILSRIFAETPGRILALEMGGNNPLIVHQINSINALDAAVYHTIQSGYITAGQRCTCARRLIVVDSPKNRSYVDALIKAIPKIKVGPYTDTPSPFMGPLISLTAKEKVIASYQNLLKNGAKPLVPLQSILSDKAAFVSPGLVDVTEATQLTDEEIFGPLLQLKWVANFEKALEEGNNTAYGLAAGLLSESKADYELFYSTIKAGVVNWNRPTTGASSRAPFGGIKNSGNHRPSAFYAADYSAYPVASSEAQELSLPKIVSPGIHHDNS